MLYRMFIMLALLPIDSQASQKPSTIQLPLDVTSIIISHVCKGSWVHSLNYIKNLNITNKEWHATLNTPRIFKQIVLSIAERADGYDEITLAKTMRNWPAFQNSEFQEWFTVRRTERDLENEFLSAAENNNLALITGYITQRKININARNKWGKTALSIAASSRQRIDALKEILKHNPDINLPNKDGWTPLKKASSEGNTQAVKLLLATGADPNRADDDGYTPLLNATFKNYLEIMKLLIDAGADINHFPHDRNYNPLIGAVTNNSLESVSLLLAAGARKDLKNRADKTAWDIAKERRSLTEILLIENQNLESILSSITASAGLEDSVWYRFKT